tara:strand:- start:226 stop:1866 length:1641 start_codon:yes stop_codon:yes gene_type:complete
MGYGLLIANYINKDLLKINIGYIGLFGLLACSIISYITIYITNHGYTHNIFLHLIGISSFIYFFYKKKMEFKFSYFLLIFILLFIGLLIIRNHDDFSYYHLTYSLGLTEEKLILGLGNLGNRYNKHSSIFFLNSIIYLPIIKYYLFHSTGWITLLFINFIFLNQILSGSKKNLDCEFYISLLFFLFINYKFFRIGGYGTDVSGQIIILSILPLILKLYNFDKVKEISKNNLSIIILLITYASTIKSFLILNFLYLLPLLYFTKAKNIKAIIIPKVYAISFLTIFLLASINISYSGCAIYPVKVTCFENQLEWSLKKNHVSNQNKWYQQWSKSGAGINYRTLSPEQYIKKLNWVPNWYERYFKYKFKETLLGVIFLSLLVFFLFNSNKNKATKPSNGIKRSSLITIAISFVLFFEWFWHHPALRYGGYYLLVTLMFMPISVFLSRKSISFNKKYSMIIFLIFLSYSLFNLKNFTRIKEEMKIVKNNNFPFFYSKDQKSNRVNIGNNIFIYIPLNEDGCWISKTPCAGRSDHVLGKKIGPYKAIIKKF